MRKLHLGTLVVVACLASGVLAAETVAYTYDVKGRIVKVVRAGSVNNGAQTGYRHDKGDNRVRVKVSGAPT